MSAKAKAQSSKRAGTCSKTTWEASKANTNYTAIVRKRSETASNGEELLRDFLKAAEKR